MREAQDHVMISFFMRDGEAFLDRHLRNISIHFDRLNPFSLLTTSL